MWLSLMGFFFLFFLASAVAAAGPLWTATRAAVEVFWGTSLAVVSADMGGIARDAAGRFGFMPFIVLGGVAFGVHSIVSAADSFPRVW